jgi:hypothetical protein
LKSACIVTIHSVYGILIGVRPANGSKARRRGATKTLVVYDSVYGNTAKIAQQIAKGK